jgi:transcriptional regulator with XRE-family HTH domain
VDAFAVAFGARLRSLRRNLGLSQEEVAHRAGIHVTYLSGIERGRRNPSLKNLRRVAMALDVSVRELFSFEAPLP